MAASIPHFVAFEVRAIDTFCRLGFLASGWHRALIAMRRMEMVIYVALELSCAMKPGAGANESVSAEPLWAVIAGRSTVIGGSVIVAIRAFRGYANVDADLGLYSGGANREADCRNS